MSKILTKSVKIKNKGEFIRKRYVYKFCGVPVYFRNERISYAKEMIDIFTSHFPTFIFGSYSMYLALGEYIVNEPNIEDKIRNLISNLKPKQAQVVLQIINRLKENYLNKEHKIEIFCLKEIESLSQVRHFWSGIMEITPNLFCYEGYFLPLNHFYPNAFLDKHGLHILESKTLDSIRHKDFIDVGGFVGDSAIIFEREFCNKNIYTFEASKTNFKLLEETLKLNNCKRIIPINKGLGAKFESLEISINGGASSMNEKVNAINTYEEVEIAEIITLDSYVAAHDIDVGFIKVDIEGFEQEFLKGAFETISRFKPAMLISIYHNASDFFDIKPLIESWNLGYTFKFHKPVDGGISGELALYCEIL